MTKRALKTQNQQNIKQNVKTGIKKWCKTNMDRKTKKKQNFEISLKKTTINIEKRCKKLVLTKMIRKKKVLIKKHKKR